MQFLPDYSIIHSPDTFTSSFGPPFTGPGFYLTKKDTILVIPLPPEDEPTRDNIWHKDQPNGTLYRCHVWNAPFNELMFAAASPPPTRHDSRDKDQG